MATNEILYSGLTPTVELLYNTGICASQASPAVIKGSVTLGGAVRMKWVKHTGMVISGLHHEGEY